MFKGNKPAIAIAMTALVVAMAGGAFAAATIGTDDLRDGAVTKKKIAKRAVDSSRIANESIQANRIKDAAISTNKLRNAAVTGTKLAFGSVNSAAIKSDAITSEKLADDSVTGTTLARVFRRSEQAGVENGDVASVSAECNEGETLLSGGGSWAGNSAGLILRASAPSATGDAWTVSGQNASGGIKQLVATALCLGETPD